MSFARLTRLQLNDNPFVRAPERIELQSSLTVLQQSVHASTEQSC